MQEATAIKQVGYQNKEKEALFPFKIEYVQKGVKQQEMVYVPVSEVDNVLLNIKGLDRDVRRTGRIGSLEAWYDFKNNILDYEHLQLSSGKHNMMNNITVFTVSKKYEAAVSIEDLPVMTPEDEEERITNAVFPYNLGTVVTPGEEYVDESEPHEQENKRIVEALPRNICESFEFNHATGKDLKTHLRR